MKPSFSVILFTVLAGAGYGLWCLLGLAIAIGTYPAGRGLILVPLALGFVLVSAGLLASVAHLGQPLRAWRAFSQWRSSWLSREGIAAVLTYLPMLVLATLAEGVAPASPGVRIAAALLVTGSLITVLCTARIYTSLKPVAAWRQPLVLPGYVLFSLASGALWLWSVLALHYHAHPQESAAMPVMWLALLIALLASAAILKRRYWRVLDRLHADPGPDVTGLGGGGKISSFERPHTESNYLLREMGFVLARRHATRLRDACMLGAFLLPMVLAGFAVLSPGAQAVLAPAAASLAMLGLLLERWLFFAQARHRVVSYYSP